MARNKVLTVKSCTIYDDDRAQYRTFLEGDEFDVVDDANILAKMGEHLFAPQPEAANENKEVELKKMKVPDLLEIAMEMGLEPKSMKKMDLIQAIEEARSVEGA